MPKWSTQLDDDDYGYVPPRLATRLSLLIAGGVAVVIWAVGLVVVLWYF